MESKSRSKVHLPSRLRTAREAKGISQRELARVVGSTSASISQFESGKRIPGVKLIERLAAELGVTVDFLLGHPAKGAEYGSEAEELAKLASLLHPDDVKILIAMTRAFIEHRRAVEGDSMRDVDEDESIDGG